MLSVLIVDDEPFARENLKMLLEEYCEGIGEIFLAGSASEARKTLQEVTPDLVFLDIMMPGEDGFSFLKSLEEKPFQLVFTTAFREHAIRAFKENAIDYLEKPIDIEELQRAVAKVKVSQKAPVSISGDRMNRILHNIALSNSVEKTLIHTRDGFAVVRNVDIVHLEASENYTTIFMADGKKYVSSGSIKSFEDKLDPMMFFRTHKSHIINIVHHLREFNRSEGNMVILSNGAQVPVARRKVQEFLDRLNMIT
ncbi:MAG: hypothetical protein RL220_1649 [Bacteroidota bacterium]